MRHRVSGGENLYDADEEITFCETELAIFAYMFGYDPKNLDSFNISEAVAELRLMWRYSSDTRNSGTAQYTTNAIPRFFSKVNATLTDRVRKASWNHKLAKAVKNGQ